MLVLLDINTHSLRIIPLDEWIKVMNLDLNSVFYCCKAIVPHYGLKIIMEE